jgi:hypothetical protein
MLYIYCEVSDTKYKDDDHVCACCKESIYDTAVRSIFIFQILLLLFLCTSLALMPSYYKYRSLMPHVSMSDHQFPF